MQVVYVEVRYHVCNARCIWRCATCADPICSQSCTFNNPNVPRRNQDHTWCTWIGMPSFALSLTHTHLLQTEQVTQHNLTVFGKAYLASGEYNVAAGMLIQPWVKALHLSSLPHSECVKSVFGTSFCRRESTACHEPKQHAVPPTARNNLYTSTGNNLDAAWQHGGQFFGLKKNKNFTIIL